MTRANAPSRGAYAIGPTTILRAATATPGTAGAAYAESRLDPGRPLGGRSRGGRPAAPVAVPAPVREPQLQPAVDRAADLADRRPDPRHRARRARRHARHRPRGRHRLRDDRGPERLPGPARRRARGPMGPPPHDDRLRPQSLRPRAARAAGVRGSHRARLRDRLRDRDGDPPLPPGQDRGHPRRRRGARPRGRQLRAVGSGDRRRPHRLPDRRDDRHGAQLGARRGLRARLRHLRRLGGPAVGDDPAAPGVGGGRSDLPSCHLARDGGGLRLPLAPAGTALEHAALDAGAGRGRRRDRRQPVVRADRGRPWRAELRVDLRAAAHRHRRRQRPGRDHRRRDRRPHPRRDRW